MCANATSSPPFSTLDRMARRVRATVNRRLFAMVDDRLSPEVLKSLDALLVTAAGQQRSAYNDLKAVPKRPTVGHLGVLVLANQAGITTCLVRRVRKVATWRPWSVIR